MGTSQIPDVRVTLSAQGVDDIIKAFQNVSAAAKKTGKDSAGGLGVLNDAMRELKTLAPTIGIAAAAAGIAVLVKNAFEGADAIGKLQQKTGMTTETLSTLAYGAKMADVEFDSLSGGLLKFNKTMAQLDQGNATAGSAVRRLLGSSTALNGMDTEQRFTTVVTALAKMQDGYQKTRAAQDFFGKSGAELIPFLNELGEGGLEQLRKKAEQLGLVMSQQVVDAISSAKDAMKDLHAEAEGMATQFVSGLAPAVATAGQALVEATTGDGVNGWQTLGQGIGWVIKAITKGFLAVGETIGFVIGEAMLLFDDFGAHAKDTLKGVGNAWAMMAANVVRYEFGLVLDQKTLDRLFPMPKADTKNQFLQRLDQFRTDLGEQFTALDNPPVAPKHGKPAAGGSVQETAAQNARLAALKAGLADELALWKAQGDLVAAEQQRAYDEGKLTIAEYFDARAKAIQEGTAKDIATLTQERDALAKTPIPVAANETDDQIAAKEIQRRQEIAALDTKIQIARIEGQKQLEANADTRHKAEDAMVQKRLDAEKQIQAAEGDTYGAALEAIKKQAAALATAHVPQSVIDRLTELQTAKAKFDEIGRQGALAMGALTGVQGGLQNQVAAGALYPFQAVERYDAAVQATVPHLRDLAAQQRAAAITPEEIQKADQFSASIEALAASSSRTSREMAALKAGIEGGLTTGLTDFLSTGIQQAGSFGAAIGSMAQSVLASIQRVVAGLLAARATAALLKLVPGVGGSDSAGQGAQVAAAAAAGVAQAAPLSAAAVATTAAGASLITGGSMVMAAAGALQVAASTLLLANSQGSSSDAGGFASLLGGLLTTGFAEGGVVSGPGTSTSDSIAARLSAGEFVVRAAAVRQPGALSMLEQINRGMHLPAIRGIRRGFGFADGGLVPGAAAAAVAGGTGSAAGGKGHVLIGLEEGLVAKHMDTNAGHKVVVRAVARNRNAVSQSLGIKHR